MGEEQNPSYLKSSVKYPQSVIIWGAMFTACIGKLYFLESKVTTTVYQNVLEDFMSPSAEDLYGDADFIFLFPQVFQARSPKYVKTKILEIV